MKRLLFPIALFALLAGPWLHAAEITATPSSTEITVDENVSVEFKTKVDGLVGHIGNPGYEAPDFDEVNVYARSQGVESSISGGQIVVRHTQSVVSVLHPKKAGRFQIRNIQVTVNGKIARAPDIVIDVRPSGTPLARGSGASTGSPPQSQLPGGGLHAQRQQASLFFLRTEPSKLRAYKGEQILLTYALYTRVQLLNIQVERYPSVSGFLKEDIDIPLLRGHLDYTPSVVNGHEYRRAVLAQYAIYPLKDGTLSIDEFTGKFSYQAGARLSESDDPFQMLNQFFRAMQTATDVRSSDRVSIEVMPLPGAGQPANFSGLVGDFDITAVVDKYSVKMGEPINVKVKVEGKGHAGSLEHLNVAWPPDFELYEDKSNTQFLKTGQTERLFEYMLIPKTKGRFDIPAIELTMFNPETKAYQSRKTQPLSIEVLEGSLGNVYVAKGPSGAPAAPGQDVRYWMDAPPREPGTLLRAVARGVAMASMVLAALSLWSLGGSADEASRQEREKTAQALRERAKALRKSDAPALEVFGEVESILGQVLELHYGILIGSLTRSQIRQQLLERVPGEKDDGIAKRVETLLETCEYARYAPSDPAGGDRQAIQRACDELARLVERIYRA